MFSLFRIWLEKKAIWYSLYHLRVLTPVVRFLPSILDPFLVKAFLVHSTKKETSKSIQLWLPPCKLLKQWILKTNVAFKVEKSMKFHWKIIAIFTRNLNSAFLCNIYLLILHEVDWKCILNLLKRAKLYPDIYQTNYTMVHAHIWSVYEQPFFDIFQIFLHLARTHLFFSNNFHGLQFLLDCPNLR